MVGGPRNEREDKEQEEEEEVARGVNEKGMSRTTFRFY